ncbi:MAG TPA: tripartite tricarboxylate transporter substrate-binding protein [Alphaproteobacteria bacterium]|jgi:tripartite-type tricarboxylate transporter receptor subunit TctC|nr:tripartite tricarboxylate transporter substrate-binding protein [Alphaproteobacteria bacterium]
MRFGPSLVIASLALASLVAAAPASAQEATFFKGREISLGIGFGPGGGYDTYGRLFARHYGRFVSGNPTVVAKNEPGAGGIRLASTIYNVAKKDGTELALFAASTALEPLFGNKDAKYETTKFTWIGNMDSDVSSCGLWKHSGIKKWEDMKTKETTFGSTGPAAITSIHPRVIGALLGLKTKVIHGYSGTRDVNLAMQKGEVDGTCGLYMSSIRSQYQKDVDEGNLTIVITLGAKRPKEFPNVPSIFELVKNDSDKQLAELIFGSDAIGRPISAPPGLPAERTVTLRNAFNAMVKDQTFLAEATKIGLSIEPMTGEKVQELFADFVKTPKPVVEKAMAVMGR